uniref:Uncharacterized protein n=1 Tax=Tanacetum cinerariifolium TaxID=118510 RepID=A0A6L2L7E6_TANCI|nr:hypothetical protein [Tanacetum cinerariifolium]
MAPKRNNNIYDVYERIMAIMDDRLDQFVDQFANRMNDMLNPKRRRDRNSRRSEGEELENSLFEGDGSSLFVEREEWEDDRVTDDDYGEGPVEMGRRWMAAEEWGRRVRESGVEDRIDRETRNLFGFAGKIPSKKSSGGGSMVAAVAAAGGLGWPDNWRRMYVCVLTHVSK